METKTLFKILGIASTIIGAGATVVSEFVNEKKMDDKIAEKVTEKVTEALANKE